MNRLLVLLLLEGGCRAEHPALQAGMGAPDSLAMARPIDREKLWHLALTPQVARIYRLGRRDEIAALRDQLREPAPHQPLALDSIGAAAAGIPTAEYRELVALVDRGLMHLGDGGTRVPSAEERSLDSIRLERRVLLIRVEAPP